MWPNQSAAENAKIAATAKDANRSYMRLSQYLSDPRWAARAVGAVVAFIPTAIADAVLDLGLWGSGMLYMLFGWLISTSIIAWNARLHDEE